jgi:hypothetical protein
MILGILLLLAGLTISAVAIYYSVIGLAAIFAGATLPIYVMGGTLEVAKLIAATWLKANWHRPIGFIKYYMSFAVLLLMVITSMGIFGFLSKAHLDQTVPTGDVQSQVALIDEKIQNERSTIEDARRLLKQLDDAVIGIQSGEGREIRLRDGTTRIENPAERALQVRRAQAADRAALTKTIEEAQTRIVKLQEEKAPIASKLRAVEAEVGPIKYIASFIYGENPDKNLLEKAVTWVIILIVIVFDPLAIAMLLAAQMTFKWYREEKNQKEIDENTTPSPWIADVGEKPTEEELAEINSPEESVNVDESPSAKEKSILEQHPYLNAGFPHFKDLKPIVAPASEPEVKEEPKITVTAEVEFVPAVQENSTEDSEEVKKKNQYMIKESGQQIVKKKD